jgi:hypothetical protein
MTMQLEDRAGRTMKFGSTLGMLGLSWLALLGFVKSLPAQTPADAWQFEGMMSQGLFDRLSPGLLTITAATVTFSADDDKHSLEVPIRNIADVKGHTKLKSVTIRLKNGKTEIFMVCHKDRNLAPVEPLVEALTAAMTGQPGPLPIPAITPPKRNFAPIPPPPAPVDAPAAPVSIVAGQTPDQVKAALGQPDRIDLPPSSAKASNQVIWSYKSLTVTFVDGKVAVVKRENRP